MDDLKKISDLLSELSLLADEVQASTGEQPTAQEVIDWVQDFIDKEISTRSSTHLQEVHRQ
jgi:disulfide oxidoreductase YuzD